MRSARIISDDFVWFKYQMSNFYSTPCLFALYPVYPQPWSLASSFPCSSP